MLKVSESLGLNGTKGELVEAERSTQFGCPNGFQSGKRSINVRMRLAQFGIERDLVLGRECQLMVLMFTSCPKAIANVGCDCCSALREATSFERSKSPAFS